MYIGLDVAEVIGTCDLEWGLIF